MRLAHAGDLAFLEQQERQKLDDLAPGIDHLIGEGTIVLIPAGGPVWLGNWSVHPVSWLQFQIETPATVWACGSDPTGIHMELLASDTLPDSISSPAEMTLSREQLLPGQGIAVSRGDLVQLVGPAGHDGEGFVHGEDAAVRNDGQVPLDIVVFTIRGQLATT